MKAVFLDFDTMGGGLDLAPLRAIVPDLTIYDITHKDELGERIRDAEVVLTNKMRLNEALIGQAPKLCYIGLTATGTDNIDLVAAGKFGIAVTNIRDYCTDSVAEHVFGVLLSLTHSLPLFRQTVREGAWQKASDPFLLVHPVSELRGRSIGIVGYGALGKGVARLAEAFGMEVLISARPGADEVPEGRVAFDELLTTADVLSLHCPLNDDTRGLLDRHQFARMKDSAILVNTARGGLVESAALVDALNNGEIAAAAVDVLPIEPPADGDPLLDYTGDNLVVTPHIAWASDEARQNAIVELANNIRAFIDGERRNRVD